MCLCVCVSVSWGSSWQTGNQSWVDRALKQHHIYTLINFPYKHFSAAINPVDTPVNRIQSWQRSGDKKTMLEGLIQLVAVKALKVLPTNPLTIILSILPKYLGAVSINYCPLCLPLISSSLKYGGLWASK